MLFDKDEYHGRWNRLYDSIEAAGARTAVVWQRSAGGYDRAGDLHWLCNYASLASGQEPSVATWPGIGRGFAALVFHDRQEPTLHIAEPVELVDETEIAPLAIHSHDNLPAGVGAQLAGLGVEGTVLHNADDFLPILFGRELAAAAPGITFEHDDHLIYRAHRIKSPAEHDVMREAGRVASSALTALMSGLMSGQSEREASAAAAAAIVRGGGGFQRIGVAHGARSERVFWSSSMYGYSDETPATGDLVRGWVYGPIYGGYWLDPGRTAVVGNKPTAAQRTLLEAGNDVVERLLDAIRPGVSSADVGLLGDELMAAAGNEAEGDYWELYGHGVGKDFYLPPAIPAHGSYAGLVDTYDVGMAVTVEIFLRHAGVGMATFERTGLVTERGVELLDDTPMIWW
ncbi:M24 family metallopeptidase [Pimelobacter simplex]|uniref:Aminopeptidase YpdF (MP-, MA-, MS-, AP-, NP-specific) n=1 Tax=Nocardioides simplex TaxID=2045 RepID=A0A0C5XBW7_NOCSI|nr:M24 family metallopeptidase [Pimelobacter simplex]AJR18805.1 Aminopeptidase YpdF (MP-, MA-, MS-, AP-, NP- specific) [Pimelobacter simplex]MCG8149384.1 M24 family metallopeptidase [Pimelobacter simplex]GEB16490.1 Xaa-Pro aminopeptidase [Pimelobacter simplex]SFM19804.1 Xaa-Pro aminopeptidase [Pimelobacter simplex]